jgi:hypothetical protein
MRKSVLTFALGVSLFLLVVSAKWATFHRFGSPMPDWDQWDAEALELLVPWFEKDNFISHLFAPHNEHRVILTKLQNLALVLLNGQWDSRLEAVTNAMLHSALAVGFWISSRRWLVAPASCLSSRPGRREADATPNPGQTPALISAVLFVLTFVLFGLPFAWQNVLGGFHSQQYWLIGLSFTAIVTLPFAPAWSGRWWIGTAAAILVLGSMASGFFAATVVAMLLGWRLIRREIAFRAACPTLLLAAALIAIGVITRVEVSWHQGLKAKTAHDFFFSIVHSLQWPLQYQHWAAIIMWLPWLLVAWAVVRRPPGQPWRASDAASQPNTPSLTIPPAAPSSLQAAQTIAALGGWVLAQIIATAYARGANADYPASRYMDTLMFGALVNGAALGWLIMRGSTAARALRVGTWILGAAWLVTFGVGFHSLMRLSLDSQLPDAKKYSINAEANMRRYLATNDRRHLNGPDIPYPSVDGLIERLAKPSLRALMPLPIRTPLTINGISTPAGAFLQNDARHGDLEHPPRAGLSPALTPLDYTVTWGTFQAELPAASASTAPYAVWVSSPISPPPFRWLKFETAGDTGHAPHAVRLTLRAAATGQILDEVRPGKRAGDTWRAAYIRTPRVKFVVVAEDASSAAWLAFSPPVEMGGLSYLAWQFTKHGLLILFVASALTCGLALFAWFFNRPLRMGRIT